jgi:hypothetical protein
MRVYYGQVAGHDLDTRRTAALIAAALCAGLLVLAATGGARPHQAKKRLRVGGAVALNETPVQSGTVAARRGCQRDRFVEIRRASNDALVGTATTTASGAFSAPGGYSGQEYALARSTNHKQGPKKIKIKCLAVRSPVISVGVGDLVVTQVAVPGGTGGNPAYDVTVTNRGPDVAQDVVITGRPNPVPANGQFTLNATFSATACSLSAATVICTAGTLAPAKSVTRRIAFTCGMSTVRFNGSATASSTARDPDIPNTAAPNLASAAC